jgi:hypothetical protein
MSDEPIILNIQKYLFFDDYYNDIKKDIKNIDFSVFLNSFCRIDQNYQIIIDYRFFKLIAFSDNYELFKLFLVDKINKVLSEMDKIILHVNLDSISLIDIEKHYNFLISLAKWMSINYPNKLEKCYIYSSGYIIHSIYNMLTMVLDKDTTNKIMFVK